MVGKVGPERDEECEEGYEGLNGVGMPRHSLSAVVLDRQIEYVHRHDQDEGGQESREEGFASGRSVHTGQRSQSEGCVRVQNHCVTGARDCQWETWEGWRERERERETGNDRESRLVLME